MPINTPAPPDHRPETKAGLVLQTNFTHRRRHLRLYPDRLGATIFARGARREVRVDNLSLSGARLTVNGLRLAAGDYVTLRFSIGTYGETLVACQVRNAAPGPSGPMYGVSFDSLDPAETDRLSQFLYDLLKKGRGSLAGSAAAPG